MRERCRPGSARSRSGNAENTLHFGRICLLTPLLALLSVVGDLSFSIIKRTYGIKDYGNLMPGHGGVLDRFYSVLFITPAVYFIAIYWPIAF